MERESFIFYRSFYEAIYDLKDDIKLEVFTAITEYALYGKVPEDLKPVARGLFTLIRPNLDVNIARYESGKRGGRKPKNMPVSPESSKTPSAKPVTPQPPYTATIEEEVTEMKRSQQWKDSVCIRYSITPEQIDFYLGDFALKCHKQHTSFQDAKSNFCYWLQNQLQKLKDQDKKEQKKKSQPAPAPDDYSYSGGFGGQDQ